jgi:hypothetical protein
MIGMGAKSITIVRAGVEPVSHTRRPRFTPPETFPGTRFCYRLSKPQSHSAGRLEGIAKLKKEFNDRMGNRARDQCIKQNELNGTPAMNRRNISRDLSVP